MFVFGGFSCRQELNIKDYAERIISRGKRMKTAKNLGSILLFIIAISFPFSQIWADGGYFSSRAVAVSADQQAIIIKDGDEISMTFSHSKPS